MDCTVAPWNGETGYICLPRAENIPEPRDGWELIKCPVCGESCYLSPETKEILAVYKQLKGACTLCALKAGFIHSPVSKCGVDLQ